MTRLFLAAFLALLPCGVWADCATYQRAYNVPPPASGRSEDPGGPMGCTREALAMFEVNKTAEAEAQPVTDLADLQGSWLSDAVLAGLLGITVSGQELLVIGPGEADRDLTVTQYWLKAASPRNGASSVWSETGAYHGVVAQARLIQLADGGFEVARFGDAITYGGRVLEFERSYELFVKAQLNHFELPLELALQNDVLVLKGQRRDPASRQVSEYRRTYTRVAPGAAQAGLAFAAVFEQSQIRYTDCLAHQITVGQGPLFDVLGAIGLEDLIDLMAELTARSIRREALSDQMRGVGDADEKARLRDEMQTQIEDYIAFTRTSEVRSLIERIMTDAGRICPPLP